MSKVLIIGGGHAGANTAYALRKDGFDGEITIISDEGYLPYHRPPLSKDFLKQNMATEKLSFKSSNFYEEQNISINLNTRINAIDLELSHAKAKDNLFHFDYLVFATGASPRLLPMENADAKNLFYLRQITDVLSIHESIGSAKNIVLIGGGYIGLEVASALFAVSVGGAAGSLYVLRRLSIGTQVPFGSSRYNTCVHPLWLQRVVYRTYAVGLVCTLPLCKMLPP